jgi:hypothetical protein
MTHRKALERRETKVGNCEVQQVGATVVVAKGGWAPVATRWDQLKDHDVGPNLEEVKAGQ